MTNPVPLITDAFVAVAPNRVVLPGTVEANAREPRQTVGATYNKANPTAGWKLAYKDGWRVKRCTIQTTTKYGGLHDR